MQLLTASNYKLLKSADTEFLSVGLHLLPHTLANGEFNTCKFSTPSCRTTCLAAAGKGSMSKVVESRRLKTMMYLNDRENFMRQLDSEIFYYKLIAKNNNKTLTVRLNLTSDIDWQQEFIDGKTLFELHRDATFYDYTKDYSRISFYNNYSLIYSYDSINHSKAMKVMARGDSLAVVFEKTLPKTFEGFDVVNGDNNDLIFQHPKNIILGLKYKNVIIKGLKNKDLIKTSTLVVKDKL
jgi:hypothetical protein